MRVLRFVLVGFVLTACRGGLIKEDMPELRLLRRPEGRVAVAVHGLSVRARALQLAVRVESTSAVVLDAPRPASGLGLDTVRLRQHGDVRAIIFAGDKRGIRIPPNGDVMLFRARPMTGRLSIESGMVVAEDGTSVPVGLGPALSLR